MNMESKLAQISKGHEEPDLHDAIAKRVAAWWWGCDDEEIAGHLSVAKMIAREPVGEAVYLARVADDSERTRWRSRSFTTPRGVVSVPASRASKALT